LLESLSNSEATNPEREAKIPTRRMHTAIINSIKVNPRLFINSRKIPLLLKV
jgi:hypothetical protein